MTQLTLDQQIQALQTQANQAWANAVNRGSQGYSPGEMGAGAGNHNLDDYNRINSQLQALQAKQPGGGAGAPTDRIQQDRDATFADTEGRGAATMDDPRVNAALDQLQKVMGGQDAPYTQQVQDQLIARHGDMSAAAEGANADSLRDGIAARGGNINDPSAQAALRQLQQGRQQDNQAAAGDIGTQATLQNFGARMNATGQLASTRLAQLGEANSQYNQGARYRSMSQTTGPHVNAQTQAGMPSFLGNANMQIPQFRFQPLQQPNYQQPQQQAAPTQQQPSRNYTPPGAAQYNPGVKFSDWAQDPVANSMPATGPMLTTQNQSTNGNFRYRPSYQLDDSNSPDNNQWF